MIHVPAWPTPATPSPFWGTGPRDGPRRLRVARYLREEAGAHIVERALAEDAVIGALSFTEVLSKLTDRGEDPTGSWTPSPDSRSTSFRSTRISPSRAGGFARSPRRRDCPSAIARAWRLGLRLGRRVLTANAAWLRLVPDVDVEVIR